MLVPPRVLAPSNSVKTARSSAPLIKSSSGLTSCSSPGPARRSLENVRSSENLFKPGLLHNGLDGNGLLSSSPGPARRSLERVSPAVFLHSGSDGIAQPSSSPGPARRSPERVSPAVFLHSGSDGNAQPSSSPGPARRSLDRVGTETLTLLKSPSGLRLSFDELVAADALCTGSSGAGKKPTQPACATPENDTDIRSLQIQVAALYVQLQELTSKYEALSSKFDGIGPGLPQSADMPTYSDKLSADVEERLVAQVMEAIETSMRELGQSRKKTTIGASLSHASECGSPDDEPQRKAGLVDVIADQVITRVNADPRICQLVESHQSLQDSFSKLLGLMDKENLEEMVIDTRQTCKAIAVEMRQLRQRRNQDASDNWLRFDDLERKLQTIEGGCNGRIEGNWQSCVKRQFLDSDEQTRTIDAAILEGLAYGTSQCKN